MSRKMKMILIKNSNSKSKSCLLTWSAICQNSICYLWNFTLFKKGKNKISNLSTRILSNSLNTFVHYTKNNSDFLKILKMDFSKNNHEVEQIYHYISNCGFSLLFVHWYFYNVKKHLHHLLKIQFYIILISY